MLKCNMSDICGWTKCGHFNEHSEIIGIFGVSLCKDENCNHLKEIVRCEEQ